MDAEIEKIKLSLEIVRHKMGLRELYINRMYDTMIKIDNDITKYNLIYLENVLDNLNSELNEQITEQNKNLKILEELREENTKLILKFDEIRKQQQIFYKEHTRISCYNNYLNSLLCDANNIDEVMYPLINTSPLSYIKNNETLQKTKQTITDVKIYLQNIYYQQKNF